MTMNGIPDRLERIDDALTTLIEQHTLQEWHDTTKIARILWKSAYSVWVWYRLVRVYAEK
jgi:hypothetical protein